VLSNEELKQSQFGRDVLKFGLSIDKVFKYFALENRVGYQLPGESTQKFGNVKYTYGYGGVIEAGTHPSVSFLGARVGGFLDMHLGDYYKVQGGAFEYNPGRYRLVSFGPEVQYQTQNLKVGMQWRRLIDKTQDASLDTLGDLMGAGTSQGSVNAYFSVLF
jgi:hypothetical protein